MAKSKLLMFIHLLPSGPDRSHPSIQTGNSVESLLTPSIGNFDHYRILFRFGFASWSVEKLQIFMKSHVTESYNFKGYEKLQQNQEHREHLLVEIGTNCFKLISKCKDATRFKYAASYCFGFRLSQHLQFFHFVLMNVPCPDLGFFTHLNRQISK